MDKKTLIGLLIVGVILFGYVFYNSKQVAKYQQEQYRADSIARAEHPERYVEEVPLSDTGKYATSWRPGRRNRPDRTPSSSPISDSRS